MATKRYDICKPIKYGEEGEKTFWANVGKMTEFIKEDGSVSRIIEIHAIGLKANVFPVKPRQEGKNAPNSQVEAKDELDTIQADEGQPGANSDEAIPF